MNKGAAAACYIPVPGLAWLVARSAPQDRLVRHHARQGGLLAILSWVLLIGDGFLLQAPGLAETATLVAGTVVGLMLLAIVLGAASALRGRFLRLRPLWDIMAAARAPASK